MGYELVYHYYKKAEKGYDMEERFTTSGKIGDPFEEVSLERLATVIMSQYARRDIMVDEVEVYELKKVQITCRESAGGLVLKNKKFNLDLCSKNLESVDVIEQGRPADIQPHNQIQAEQVQPVVAQAPTVQPAPVHAPKVQKMPDGKIKLNGKMPIRYEVFQPEDYFMKQFREQKMAFTVGNKYPIFSERIHPNETIMMMLYTTVNDKGMQQEVVDKFFSLEANVVLGNGFENRTNPTVVKVSAGDGDVWSNMDIVDEEIPELRRN